VGAHAAELILGFNKMTPVATKLLISIRFSSEDLGRSFSMELQRGNISAIVLSCAVFPFLFAFYNLLLLQLHSFSILGSARSFGNFFKDHFYKNVYI